MGCCNFRHFVPGNHVFKVILIYIDIYYIYLYLLVAQWDKIEGKPEENVLLEEYPKTVTCSWSAAMSKDKEAPVDELLWRQVGKRKT